MNDLTQAIERHLLDADENIRLLEKYYGGAYTGALFDTAEAVASDEPDSITARDVAAVALLSVPMTGQAVKGVIVRSEVLSALLGVLQPVDLQLADATDEQVDALFAVHDELDKITGIGHVTRSKLLAHKRPHLVPIRDTHVLTSLIGKDHGSFTKPLRDALRSDPTIGSRLEALRDDAQGVSATLSTLRVLDVIVWMRVHGDQQT